MAAQHPGGGVCQEKSGFLFSHPCRTQAGGRCQKCSKSVCAKHVHPTPNGIMCTTCTKGEIKTARQQGRQWDGWDDDPHLYDTYYYRRYGYYDDDDWGGYDDFTEADGHSLVNQGEGDWESDMGGS